MNQPSLLVSFDPATWKTAVIFPNSQTDQETAMLLVLAEKMLAAPLPDRSNAAPPARNLDSSTLWRNTGFVPLRVVIDCVLTKMMRAEAEE